MADELLAFEPLKPFTCTGCGGPDDYLVREGDDALCLTCADLGHLVFLPRGDTALTRRAKKLSTLSVVVVRFSRSRGRYERQGLLVETEALATAEEQCLADEDARERRQVRDRERRAQQDVAFQGELATEIRRLFPAIPAQRSQAIAEHAGLRGSGRVGRSAAGRALDEGAVTAAVVASIRHTETNYDDLLMAGVPRLEAREQVQEKISEVLSAWRQC